MKRDMDLVRLILLETERAECQLSELDFMIFDKYSENQIFYHLEIMIEAGFLDGHVTYSGNHNPISATINGLTWNGQDFIEAMRDGRIWAKVRKIISETVGSCTFDVVKQTCNLVALKAIETALN